MSSISTYVSTAIRVVEFLFAVISLGLSGAIIHQIDSSKGRIIYTLIIAMFSIVYLIPVAILDVLNLIPFTVVYILELIFFVFWLVAFALISNSFGDLSCTADGVTYDFCQEGKALIAMTLILWLTFSTSLILTAIFSVIPLVQSTSVREVINLPSNDFTWGGIFLKTEPKESVDAEAEVGKDIEPTLEEADQTVLDEVKPLDVDQDIGSTNVDIL
ncbi:hypothetical protein DFJ63DRAFT_333672 [Scheffersomyces coipomensis]|uniref:uncharacterized protein n=1 Tax=Scheffersomyces coipomensis TaxID=1788519 RepID=UPI00315CAD14